jgi:small GTP-binding protein
MTQLQGDKTVLRKYEQGKFAISELLRSISNNFSSHDHAWQERLRELFLRLAEDRFNLVVVGRFNRGKTSIMNSIIGTNRLPVGIVPLTSVITTVTYGSEERVVLRFKKHRLIEDVPIAELSRYVTQKGNPGNVRGIDIAEVQLRAEILRRGFHFVDTPGLGSAIVENSRTTEAFLPEADAFVIVTGYESPLTQEEIEFLRGVSTLGRRIFVVINKQDTVALQERETVLAFVQDQLRTIFGENAPQVFSVSANEGLNAKLANDTARLAASGLLALEDALVGFLVSEKHNEFLKQMFGRTAELIRDMPPSSEAALLSAQLKALVSHLLPQNGNVDAAVPASQPRQLPSSQQLRTCEICSQVNETLWDFECKHQHDISTDLGIQQLFVASGGLCSFHTWQYQAVASAYGICTSYPALLDHLAEWLRLHAATTMQSTAQAKPQIPVAAPGHCKLCNVRDKAESEAVFRLGRQLSVHGANALNSLSAICIPHLEMLTRVIEDADLVSRLMSHQATLLEHVSEDMKRFALKRNATARYLESREEATAAQRALLLVAGHRDVTASAIYRARRDNRPSSPSRA